MLLYATRSQSNTWKVEHLCCEKNPQICSIQFVVCQLQHQALSGEDCSHPHKCKIIWKCDKLNALIEILTTRFYYIITCTWSTYVHILMLKLNRQLLLIKIEVTSISILIWNILILHRNQKVFHLNHLKGIFAYTMNEKGTQLKKTSNA